MDIICNWFHPPVKIGEKGGPGGCRTHGICASCRSRLLEEAQELGILLNVEERKEIIARIEGKGA